MKTKLFKTIVAGGMLLATMTVAQAQSDAEMKEYFVRAIAGETVRPEGTDRVKVRGIAAARKRVWTMWKEANKAAGGPELPMLAPLDSTRRGQIILPDSLEPSAVMDYYWGTKGDSLPEGGYPFFLYLHGSGPRDTEWSNGLHLARLFHDAPSVYFIPRIPNTGAYYRWWQRSKLWGWQWLIRQLMLSDSIDARRLYVFGISEGGYGSQRLASFYADYWAAAGPMAGGEPLKNAPAENCGGIGFSLLTGAEDNGFYRNQLTYLTKLAFDSLQAVFPGSYLHRVELIPGRGHSIDYRPTTPWLKKFVRDPHPKAFVWEDFEMDGWHRTGFYNLKVNRRPESGLRTCYIVKMEGNTVNLQISDVHYRTVVTDPKWGIELQFEKSYTPARGGCLTLFLDEHLVDLDKKVTVNVNGRQVFCGKVKCNLGSMMESLAVFYDRERIFPAAVEIVY